MEKDYTAPAMVSAANAVRGALPSPTGAYSDVNAAMVEAYNEALRRGDADSLTKINAMMRALGVGVGGYASKAKDMAVAPIDWAARIARGVATGTPYAAQFGGGASAPPGAPPAVARGTQPPSPQPNPQMDVDTLLKSLDAANGGSSRASASGGMRGTDFSQGDKWLTEAHDQLGKLKLDLPQQFDAVKDYETRRSAVGARPDIEDEAYNPLQGKRLSDFMVNMGLNMLASSGDGRTFAGSLGVSAKDAKATAEAKVGKKFGLDTEDWKQKIADAKTLTELGGENYRNLSAAKKNEYDAARLSVAELGKLATASGQIAGEKSADAARRATVAQNAYQGSVKDKVAQAKEIAIELVKIKASLPENKGRSAKELYGEAYPEALKNMFNPRPDPVEKFDNNQYAAASEAFSAKYKDLAKSNPVAITTAATKVAKGQATLADMDQYLQGQRGKK